MKKIIYYSLMLFVFLTTTSYAQTKNQTMKNTENYSVEIIRYNIPPDQHSTFENAYVEAGKYLKASKYCLSYSVIHGNDEPNHYIVIIHWTSKEEHLSGFRASADFMPFYNRVKPFFNNIEEMKHYDQTANVWSKE